MEGNSIFLPPRKFVSSWQRWLFVMGNARLMVGTWLLLGAITFGVSYAYVQIEYMNWYTKAKRHNDAEIEELVKDERGNIVAIIVAYPTEQSKFIWTRSRVRVYKHETGFNVGRNMPILVGLDNRVRLDTPYSSHTFLIVGFVFFVWLGLGVLMTRGQLAKRLAAAKLLEQGLIAEGLLKGGPKPNKSYRAYYFGFTAYNETAHTAQITGEYPRWNSGKTSASIFYELKSPENSLILEAQSPATELTETGDLRVHWSGMPLLVLLGLCLATASILGILVWLRDNL